MVSVSEKDFLAGVTELATLAGWLVYHTYDSRKNQAGFPDLTMAKGGRLIFAELKSEKGRVSPHQQVWLNQLEKIKGVEVYLWRPSHIDEIVDKLMGHQNGSPLAK